MVVDEQLCSLLWQERLNAIQTPGEDHPTAVYFEKKKEECKRAFNSMFAGEVLSVESRSEYVEASDLWKHQYLINWVDGCVLEVDSIGPCLDVE